MELLYFCNDRKFYIAIALSIGCLFYFCDKIPDQIQASPPPKTFLKEGFIFGQGWRVQFIMVGSHDDRGSRELITPHL